MAGHSGRLERLRRLRRRRRLERLWRLRRRRRRRARDERGGALSLWVVLMVPVSAFAAVAAMAGPQRLAAESSVQEAADDLAALAVAWRDGQQIPRGQLISFPSDCVSRTRQQRDRFPVLRGDISNLAGAAANPGFSGPLNTQQDAFDDLLGEFRLPTPPRLVVLLPYVDPALDPVRYIEYVDQNYDLITELEDRLDRLDAQLDAWDGACTVLHEALARDLGNLGVDFGDLRGSYSDSLESSTLTVVSGFEVPCKTAADTVVFDGVHVAIAADWEHAGWAAAQVWPEGIPMAAESTGRLTQRDLGPTPFDCQDQLVFFDSQGRPTWSGSDPKPDSRKLVQSVRRSTLTG